ncbi:DNA mismatch repair protein MutS [Ferroacidibacillus organovorans]|uniref:DNA mismatch repair protein MutS n=1 Tax=Ferroacidibacillus organovorans TaxID=1765683 RepID=A0A161QNB7_9BACL|nr:DNA mismatch repair protein MutS [Ferroacidibacillus organovorans]KYP82169.1 hypothetical protein AYJ22_00515 [Ferroacidibacillus organovorans]OAG93587.1 hypothetical protein AYW79_09870 [Ferroacidibacillus organovorans]OPG15603.1 DNA mismatch repair protein MutS [Ferroacidibacillus organovorans]
MKTPMLDQYERIKASCPDALLMYRLGDFYELFYDDATLASELLGLTLTGRGKGDSRIPMCGVPFHAAEGYIGKLVDAGLRVAICEQVEDPRSVKGIVRREIVRIVTPGTAHEYLREEDGPLRIGTLELRSSRTLGAVAAMLDPLTGDCLRMEATTQELLGWFKTSGVRELIVDSQTSEQARRAIGEMATALNALVSHLPADRVTHAQDDLAQVVTTRLVEYVSYTLCTTPLHMKPATSVNDTPYLYVSAGTAHHLELLEPRRFAKRSTSLFDFLQTTHTAMGKRALRQMILYPLADGKAIEARLVVLDHVMENAVARAETAELLRGFRDLEKMCARLSSGAAGPRDILFIAQSMRRAVQIRNVWEQVATAVPLHALLADLPRDDAQDVQIEAMLVDDPPVAERALGVIREGVDPEIDRLRRIAQDSRAYMAELEARERQRTGIRSLKIAYNRVFGYYIEVTASNRALVPDDYERKQTLAGAERYVTPELRLRETEILSAEDQLRNLEEGRVRQMIEEMRRRVPEIQKTASLIGMLDAFTDLAEIALRYRFTRPVLDDSTDLEIKAGRHPVVERWLSAAYVPNDTFLSDERQLAIITGPNMGGKSTYMRQVALIVILAQIGSYVPADYARIGIVDKLFTRIGASDDVASGQSTFMVEMAETAELLTMATEKSLILLDEIGRGTATYDGLSIAEAVIEFLHDQVKARTLFATHYHELTELPQRLPRTFNLSVAASTERDALIFLHHVNEGPANRSYGIDVAKLAGVPKRVTARARMLLQEREAQARQMNREQVSFFDTPTAQEDQEARAILETLAELPLDEWTPRDALTYLFDLRERLRATRENGSEGVSAWGASRN